jgi:hypothetical protein
VDPCADGGDGIWHQGDGDFCADLAYVLSDIYCRTIVHVPGQTPDNYLWWTELYGQVLARTAINMPHSLTTSLAARCYACLHACSAYKDAEQELQYKTLDLFIEAWISLRLLHVHLFRHTAYTAIVCEAYPLIGKAVVMCKDRIAQMERQLQVNMALGQQQQQGAK